MKRTTAALLACLLALGTAAALGSTPAAGMTRLAATGPATPVLNSAVVLFVDNHRVGTTLNLRRNYVPGRKVQVGDLQTGRVSVDPVRHYRGADPANDELDGDVDTDNPYLLAAQTVIREIVDGSPLYRMWLRSGANVGYRESRDGLNWHIRDADSVIVVPDVNAATVTKDPNSGLYYLTGWSRSAAGYVEMVSSDGITFQHTRGFAGLLSRLYGDVIQAAADPADRRLYAIAKQGTTSGEVCTSSPFTRSGGRTFGTHVSSTPTTTDTDLASAGRTWYSSGRSVAADCVDARSVPPVAGTNRPAHLYGISFQRYGDQFLGFPWFFQVTEVPEDPNRSGFTDGPVDTQIASTPDVMRVPWQRAEATVVSEGRRKRPSLIPRGPEGSWDDGMIYGHAGLITTDDQSRLYYTGWNSTHRPSFGRRAQTGAATWRRDRFVGLQVRDRSRVGVMRTRGFHLPATATSRHLYVNAALGSSWLRVSAVDFHTGKVIPGFAAQDSTVVTGDQMGARVTWRGRNLGQLRSRAIRLEFTYRGGSLYSFRVT